MEHAKKSKQVIHLDHQATNLKLGDHERNYAGASSPRPKHLTIEEGTRENENPEQILISKQRWAIVAHVVQENPEVCENYDLIMDHFSGYSWTELGERHGLTRDIARGRVLKTVDYLKKRIQGHQF